MHIEVTDCQRNIPTFEKPCSGKHARQKTAMPMKTAKITQKPEASEALLIARFVDYWIVISETRSEVCKP
ncbi:hypothetical protein VKY20_15270 [Pseudomonas atacamensis]|uniref:hypothetical protein n=1 Tax=Pseudomonas atacamensis TaxID=2565368 RepID=UPI002B463D9A|nr:hypothetical protein [Pseudomonas atacamensis]MEB2856972.1 hypothetical protein [Pseudomonas atacamensis]